MTEDVSGAPRKQLRFGHASERGAVNAVRTLLEAHRHVVDEVEGRNDYGRDLIVDITERGEITGAIIGIQVKGDRRFIKDGDWEFPASPKDRRYWAESSVPIVGVLWNPDDGGMRWINLTAYARTDPTISTWPFTRPRRVPDEEPSDVKILFPKSQVLSDTTLSLMLEQLRAYLRQSSTPALLGLFDLDDERCSNAVFDCWTLGRSDARAFLLLRWALPSLSGDPLRDAIRTLSYLTPHPDVFWDASNWIPPEIKRQVQTAFRWSAQEICDLVCAVEHLEGDNGWERGGLRQCLWSLLIEDANLLASIPIAIGLVLARGDSDAVFRILTIYQYLADDPLAAAEDALAQYPELRAFPYVNDLVRSIIDFGRIDIY